MNKKCKKNKYISFLFMNESSTVVTVVPTSFGMMLWAYRMVTVPQTSADKIGQQQCWEISR